MVCDGEQDRRFVLFVNTGEEVRECHHVTGSDAMIKVMVGSIEEREQLVTTFPRFGMPTTSVVLSTPLTRHGYRVNPAAGRAPDGLPRIDSKDGARASGGFHG
jgi:Lrp/AsnC family transcriptional regulator, leucine-responsive regulatory protein